MTKTAGLSLFLLPNIMVFNVPKKQDFFHQQYHRNPTPAKTHENVERRSRSTQLPARLFKAIRVRSLEKYPPVIQAVDLLIP